MSTSITHAETQNHRVNFYDDELLRGLPSPWTIPENERNLVGHYSLGNSHWFIAYYGPSVNVAYGFVRLLDDESAEWGEIDMAWLESLKVEQPVWIRGREVTLTIPVERDPNWEICVFGELRQMDEYQWVNQSHEVGPLR